MEQKVVLDSSDIIKLIQQFLRDNNMINSLKILEDESKIKLNSVDSIEGFKKDIIQGKWDLVIKNINKLDIPLNKLMDLYEQVVIELVDNDEIQVASGFMNFLSKNSLLFLKSEYNERIKRLEDVINGKISPSDVYAQLQTTKENNRMKLAENLSKDLVTLAPNRLIFLLSEGIKHIYSNESISSDIAKYDILTGKVDTVLFDKKQIDGTSYSVKNLYKQIKFEEGSHIESCRFSYDGNYLATGSSDGFVEIWSPHTGKLASDLPYQHESVLLVHKDSVLTLNFSKDSKMLCSGDNSGNIKVFKIANGKCLRDFSNAHSKGVTCIAFTKDNALIISGSFDSLIRIYGLKSGQMIKEFNHHTSFINDLEIDWTSDRLFSSSSDGSVKIWNLKYYELSSTISPPTSIETIEIAVNNVKINPKNRDTIYISNKTNCIYLMGINGQLLKTYSTERKFSISAMVISHDGEWIYCADEDNTLYTFSSAHSVIVNSIKTHEKDVIGLTHHPNIPMLASIGMDGIVNIYT
jgi:WD40 repeat-containing protein SMU1